MYLLSLVSHRVVLFLDQVEIVQYKLLTPLIVNIHLINDKLKSTQQQEKDK